MKFSYLLLKASHKNQERNLLMGNTIITDMSGAYIEHSEVITNFVAMVYGQLKNNLCRVYPDNVQYKWTVGDEEKKIIPDASINCRVHAKKGNSFLDIPKFVMEVLSPYLFQPGK